MMANKPIGQTELLTTFLVSAPVYLTQMSRIPPPFLPLAFYPSCKEGARKP